MDGDEEVTDIEILNTEAIEKVGRATFPPDYKIYTGSIEHMFLRAAAAMAVAAVHRARVLDDDALAANSDLLWKANICAGKLAELLPDIEGLPEKRVRKLILELSDLCEELTRATKITRNL